MAKRVLQIGKYLEYWLIKDIYNTCLEHYTAVMWRFVEVDEQELNYLQSHSVDAWIKKLWERDLYKQELEAQKEVCEALARSFLN